MEPGVNILIVEDEKEWQGTYERAVNAQFTGRRVSVAEDLASAERLIDATKFAVAFVDVGLDVRNDRNVDGLRVMEKIRSIGDEETSIVVITGRSGQDLLDIVRDAIKKYGAYDTVGKRSVAPKRIRNSWPRELTPITRRSARAARPCTTSSAAISPPMSWDDQVMRAIGFRGDAGRFYSFLGGILDDYLPVVTRAGAEPVFIDLLPGSCTAPSGAGPPPPRWLSASVRPRSSIKRPKMPGAAESCSAGTWSASQSGN